MESANPYASPQQPAGTSPTFRVPTTFGEILVTGISLFGANAYSVVGLTLVIWLPIELMQSYYDYILADPEDIGRTMRTSLLIENLVGTIPTAGIIAIGNAAMNGQRPGIWFGLRSGLEAWPRMVGTRIIVGFITLLALVLFIVPGLYVGVRSAQAESVVVIERLNGMASMKRSFELTKDGFWRYLALLVVSVGFVFVVGALTAVPTTIFPEFDHWLLAASLSLLVDVMSAFYALVFVAAYWATVRPTHPIGEEIIPIGEPA